MKPEQTENINKGKVVLVGAGCGKGLLTVQGLEAVQRADVVVYDALLDEDILWETKPDCERLYVGKRSGHHSISQNEINRILVQKAKENKSVVRLKGGDSFVFGRGGEEMLYLQKERIPCEVIPGVSSAIAVPEHFGIPVTHRGVAQSFSVITGHEAGENRENYSALAKLNGTLVFLMGLSRVEEIAGELIDNGKSADTPAVVLSRGYSSEEARFDGTLGTIAKIAKEAKAPAILLVGETAGMRLTEKPGLPLSGATVTATGTVSFTRRLEEVLSALGAFVRRVPHLAIVPQTGQIPDDFADYDWLVFTSANGVDVFFWYLRTAGKDLRKLFHLKFACIGDGTRRKLWDYGIMADFVPKSFTAQELGRSLPMQMEKGERVLILRAENGSPQLTEELDAAGVRYEDRKLYRTKAIQSNVSAGNTAICEEPDGNRGASVNEEQGLPFRCETDYLVFASAEGVRTFFENGGTVCEATIVCIGELTAAALREIDKEAGKPIEQPSKGYGGWVSGKKVLIAHTHTVEGIAEIILEDWKKPQA